jgi:hypothetical protein
VESEGFPVAAPQFGQNWKAPCSIENCVPHLGQTATGISSFSIFLALLLTMQVKTTHATKKPISRVVLVVSSMGRFPKPKIKVAISVTSTIVQRTMFTEPSFFMNVPSARGGDEMGIASCLH